MNMTFSVETLPYRVWTVVPSTIGSRSLCTPWRLTSAERLPSDELQILSISSIKMMPDSSARVTASSWIVSLSSRPSISCSCRTCRASATESRRSFCCRGIIRSSMPCRSISICSMPILVKTCTGEFLCSTESSTIRSSSLPSRNMSRNLARVRSCRAS